MKIALVYRPDNAKIPSVAKTLCTWLEKNGHTVYTAPDQKVLKGTLAIKKRGDVAKMDLLISLGGDGTYLRAIRTLAGRPIPILGVNMGSLGFLTPTKSDNLTTTVKKFIDGKMELTPRSMIEVKLYRKRKLRHTWLALNDVVIERGSLAQLITIAIRSEKHLVSEVKTDGVIIATPTGSSAYNLAAGGPILHPGVSALVVTPIAPHSLTSRPLIFPDNKKLSFKLLTGKQQSKQAKAHLVIDGAKYEDISADDEITVARSDKDHLMVCDPDSNYFHLLREKLKFGDRS